MCSKYAVVDYVVCVNAIKSGEFAVRIVVDNEHLHTIYGPPVTRRNTASRESDVQLATSKHWSWQIQAKPFEGLSL